MSAGKKTRSEIQAAHQARVIAKGGRRLYGLLNPTAAAAYDELRAEWMVTQTECIERAGKESLAAIRHGKEIAALVGKAGES